MKRWSSLAAVGMAAAVGTSVLVAPVLGAPAIAGSPAPTATCSVVWGSLPETAGALTTAPITDVRAGRHECFDRLVVDVAGPAAGYTVAYVPAVRAQGSGAVVPLRGGAFLQIDVLAPAYDVLTGRPTYTPANPRELVDPSGYRTFAQAAWGGSFEGYTTVGLGVRARLPFRVFTLDGPGSAHRLVVDVAHRW